MNGERANNKKREEARRVRANMVHLDMSKVLDVPKTSYGGFSRLLPTAESVIHRLETEILPATPAIISALSDVVAESAKVFIAMLTNAQNTLTDEKLRLFRVFEDRLKDWDNAATIRERDAVAVAPITSAFHGKVDKGVIFNEGLLLDGSRRELAATSLHEVTHIASGSGDYSEIFVTTMYELAQYLAKNPSKVSTESLEAGGINSLGNA